MSNTTAIFNTDQYFASPEKIKIAVIGLGYVGLPLAIEFSKKYRV